MMCTVGTSPWLLHVTCCTCPERHSSCCRTTFEIAGSGLMRLDAGSSVRSSFLAMTNSAPNLQRGLKAACVRVAAGAGQYFAASRPHYPRCREVLPRSARGAQARAAAAASNNHAHAGHRCLPSTQSRRWRPCAVGGAQPWAARREEDEPAALPDGSACGTWLNGSRVEKAQPITLRPDDVVSFPTAGVDVSPSYKCSAAKRAARGKAKAKETSAVAAPKRQRASPKTKAAAPAPALDRRQLAALAAERRAEAEAGRRAEAAAEAKAKAEVEAEAKAKARGEAEVKATAA
eukprot:scaffold55176_cov63-Phaeocystis_antarctica.AAC.1